MNNKTTCHDGHRARMLQKFKKLGGQAFGSHELFEMFLFFSIPRVNTNETAHKLLDRFGSVRGVIDASIEELCTVDGIGEKSAMIIKIAAELYSRCMLEEADKSKNFTTYTQVAKYLSALYLGASKEIIYLLVFSNSMRLIAAEKLEEGNSNSALLNSEKILRCANSYNSTNIILAHNHPGGRAIPSGEDMKATGMIRNFVAAFGINLIEHFVVADGKCTPIIHGSRDNPTKEFEASVKAILRSEDIKLDGIENLVVEI